MVAVFINLNMFFVVVLVFSHLGLSMSSPAGVVVADTGSSAGSGTAVIVVAVCRAVQMLKPATQGRMEETYQNRNYKPS